MGGAGPILTGIATFLQMRSVGRRGLHQEYVVQGGGDGKRTTARTSAVGPPDFARCRSLHPVLVAG